MKTELIERIALEGCALLISRDSITLQTSGGAEQTADMAVYGAYQPVQKIMQLIPFNICVSFPTAVRTDKGGHMSTDETIREISLGILIIFSFFPFFTRIVPSIISKYSLLGFQIERINAIEYNIGTIKYKGDNRSAKHATINSVINPNIIQDIL